MNGPLVEPGEAPECLRALVRVSGEVDAAAFTRFSPPRDADVRHAAVLVLFGESQTSSGGASQAGPQGPAGLGRQGEGAAGPDVLLLRRADTLGSHAGQVAFPGGGAEPGDAGPVDTALREAKEETGVERSGVLPVAVLPELYVPVSRFAVTPVLAHWHRPAAVWPVDPAETAAVARLSVEDLADPGNRFRVRKPGTEWKGPAFDVDGMFVWGFTAGLLSVLLSLGGWERPWDHTDVRDLDVALAEHEAREKKGTREWQGERK